MYSFFFNKKLQIKNIDKIQFCTLPGTLLSNAKPIRLVLQNRQKFNLNFNI